MSMGFTPFLAALSAFAVVLRVVQQTMNRILQIDVELKSIA